MDRDGSSGVHEWGNDFVHESDYSQVMDDDDAPKPHYLRQWRKKRGMTQEALADALGTTKSQISELERFNLQLSPKWLHRIAPILEVSAGHILDHDPATLDNDIIDIWTRIPERDRANAAKALRGFIRTGTDD